MKDFFVPSLFLVGTLFFTYLYVTGPAPSKVPDVKREQASKQAGTSYDKLQQYRQELKVKKEILQQQADLRKTRNRLELDPNFNKRNKFHETQMAEDLGPAAYDLNDGSYEEPMTIDQRMNAFLAKKQEYEIMEQAQREAYVETFIREAYKMGYIVKVNENMEVVDVKSIDED